MWKFRTYCNTVNISCTICASAQHSFTNCPIFHNQEEDYRKRDKRTDVSHCTNCRQSKTHRHLAAGHEARDYAYCPTYQQKLAKKYEDIVWTEDSEYHAFLKNHYPTLVQHFATKQTKSNAKKSRTAPQTKSMLQAFFPDEPPDNMEYHIHIRKVANDALELTHKPPEKITMSELRAAMLDNPSYGASGMGDIPGFIIKLAWTSIKEPLLNLFNASLNLSYFPDKLKISKVVTIQKPGKQDLSQIKSIRPISLLPLIGKTFERIILKRL